MLKQRLDSPYIKKNNKLVKCTWDEAIDVVSEKIKNTNPNNIAGHIGDMVSLENSFVFKKLFNDIIGSQNLEVREKKFYINPDDKINYLFNSTIKRIEEADLILIIGSNPRHEATMLNARIKKTHKSNKLPIYSIGIRNLTYDYKIVGDSTKK